MLHDQSDNLQVKAPEYMRNSKDTVFWMRDVTNIALSNRMHIEKIIELHKLFSKEDKQDKYGRKVIYVYIYRIAPDGYYSCLERPTGKHAFDFKYRLLNGEEQEEPPLLANEKLSEELWRAWYNNPEEYLKKVAPPLQNLATNTLFPSWEALDNLNFTDGINIQHSLMLTEVAFLEQENAYPDVSGLQMPYRMMPRTKEEMDLTFDINKNTFDMREKLKKKISTNMNLTAACKALGVKGLFERKSYQSEENPRIEYLLKEDFFFTYGTENNLIKLKGYIFHPNGLSLIFEEENNNRKLLDDWFKDYFKIESDYAEFDWGYVKNYGGYATVCYSQNWSEKDISKKIRQFKY